MLSGRKVSRGRSKVKNSPREVKGGGGGVGRGMRNKWLGGQPTGGLTFKGTGKRADWLINNNNDTDNNNNNNNINFINLMTNVSA